MIFSKILDAWKKRVRRHLIKDAGFNDWCIFVKALCGSWESCHGYPYDCKCCFDNFFNVEEILNQLQEL